MRYLGITLCAALAAASISDLCAQSNLPTFEAASIKPHAPSGPRPVSATIGSRFIATNRTLRQLVLSAYSDRSVALLDQLLVGGPRWTATDGFDIEAAGAAPISGRQSNLMLRSLLSDRFQLKLHREMRELPVYDLVIVKEGKLKASDNQTPADPIFSTAEASRRVRGASGIVLERSGVMLRGTAVPMATVASLLQYWAVAITELSQNGPKLE